MVKLSKEQLDVLLMLWRAFESENIYNYKKDRFYLNRGDYFIKNKNASEIDFLTSELKELEAFKGILLKAEKTVLDNWEFHFDEKDFEKESETWFDYEKNLLSNIDFIKQKINLERQLKNENQKTISKAPEKNILIKTINELLFIIRYVSMYEITLNQKCTYLLFSDYTFLDVEKLNTYLLKEQPTPLLISNLKDIESLANRILNFKNGRYKDIKNDKNKSYSYEFISKKKDKRATYNGTHTPLFILNLDNKFKKITENEAKEYFNQDFKFKSYQLFQFENKCLEIKRTISNYLTPQQPTTEKESETKNPHPNIFTNKGFQVWERLFENFKIKESSQTDIKFCFEEMRKDGHIHNTVKQADFLRWLNDFHNWDVQKPNSNAFLKDPKRLKMYSLTIDRFNTPKKVQNPPESGVTL